MKLSGMGKEKLQETGLFQEIDLDSIKKERFGLEPRKGIMPKPNINKSSTPQKKTFETLMHEAAMKKEKKLAKSSSRKYLGY